MNLTDVTHWTNSYASGKLNPDDDQAPDYVLIQELINNYIFTRSNNLQDVIEIGCCPGRFLTLFGKNGLELNGIDFIDAVQNVKADLSNHSYKTGNFYQGDFCTYKFDRKFDVVCSFGFIEHFTNYDEIIKRHIELIKPHGFILITTPNFRGLFQYIYHFFTDRANMKKHVIPSMSPKKWRRILQSSNFEVIHEGYFGDYFWDENPSKARVQFWMQTVIKKISKIHNSIFGINKNTGSHCVIIARNKSV